MDEKLVAEALGVHDKSFGAIRPQADDLTNNPLARNFDRRETALPVEPGGARRRLTRARP
ncbi:MAG TPA: hypothetical protein VN282_26205 [Pyrinomonadaceae bacterium]|nr:hypothetical protein [Pyrinomonadaceae bacterium]